MKTKSEPRSWIWLPLAALMLAGWSVVAQTANPSTPAEPAPPPSAPAQLAKSELLKLAMPIALHPDPLIAIILPASAYPLEIVQAARFVKDTNNLPKVDAQAWDANVKAVAKFPELIAKMDADLTWTVALGEAFVEQPKELMDAIQELRAQAQKAGTLQTTQQQVVTVTNVVVLQTNVTQVVSVTNQIVQVQPANPQVVYVPTYPPTVYYPPPSYVYDPYAPLVTFGVGLAVGAIIANNCDWHGGAVWVGGGGAVWVGGGGYGDVDIDIDIDNDINIDRGDRPDRGERPTQQAGNRAGNTGTRPAQQKWQPDQNRLRTSGAPATAQTREARGWGDAATRPAQTPASGAAATRPAGGAATRPTAPARQPAQRPATPSQGVSRPTAPAQQPAARPSPSAGAGTRPAQTPSVNRSSSSAFSGANNSNARASSSRGSISRSSAGVSRGGGRGGRGGGGGRGR